MNRDFADSSRRHRGTDAPEAETGELSGARTGATGGIAALASGSGRRRDGRGLGEQERRQRERNREQGRKASHRVHVSCGGIASVRRANVGYFATPSGATPRYFAVSGER